MNKLLFLIPIFVLIGTTVFLMKDKTAELENLVPVAFKQYLNCTENVPTNYTCSSSQEFIDTYNLFMTQTYSPEAPYACAQFIIYKKLYSLTNEEINANQYFEQCYINENVRAIANTNECFFKNFYAPYYLLCGGFDIYAYPPYTPYSIGN
ncbi:hypothetical protein ABPG74_002369 [Tetrahymena malaccensis]